MTDVPSVLVALVLIFVIPFDVYVVLRVIRAALVKPRIGFLSAIAIGSASSGIAAFLAAILAVHALVFVSSSGAIRLLPAGVSIFILAAIACLASVPLLVILVWLVTIRPRGAQIHVHTRESERRVRTHRRADDPPADES
jgi:hypothetical protein